MWSSIVFTTLILTTWNLDLPIASLAFLLTAAIHHSIFLRTIASVADQPTVKPTREQLLNALIGSNLYSSQRPAGLPCGDFLTQAQMALLFNPLSESYKCPLCGRVLFQPPQLARAIAVKIAVGGVTLALVHDAVLIWAACRDIFVQGASSIDVELLTKTMRPALFALCKLYVLGQVDEAIETRGPQWWKFWGEKVRFCDVFLPLAVFWAMWMPFALQKEVDQWCS